MSTKHYTTSRADAKHLKCDTCGGRTAFQVRVQCSGRSGKKGSRSLGIYCAQHASERLEELRKKR